MARRPFEHHLTGQRLLALVDPWEVPMALFPSPVPLTLLQAMITSASTATAIWDVIGWDFIAGS